MSDVPHPPLRAARGGPWGVMQPYADAFLCAVALLLSEYLVVGFAARRQLLGPHELALAGTALLPLAVLVAAPFALGGWLVQRALENVASRRWRRALVAVGTVTAAAVAVGISTGRHLSGFRRPMFVLLVLVVVAAAIGWGSAPLARRLQWLARRGVAYYLLALLLALSLLEAANALVLPRLYPAFHAGLAALTIWLSALVARPWSMAPEPVRTRLRTAAGIGILAAIGCLGAPHRLSGYDNLRMLYLERAPLLSYAVRLGATLERLTEVEEPARGLAVPRPARGPGAINLQGRDFLLITVDALRADHVGAYGYGRPTTPEIDALAKEGVLFEAAYTPTPHTSYALSSLMTGKYMRPLLRQGVGDDSAMLATILRRYGYRTAGFYPPATFYIDRAQFQHFERTGFGFEYRKVEFCSGSERVSQLQEYLATQKSSHRLFVWVHLFEPHEPYQRHANHDFGDRSIDRYDGEIRVADQAVGGIVATMRALRPNTVVILSADHGEEFGEHGGRYHGTTVYDEQVRVPLIFHAADAIAARRVKRPVGLVDLLPTVLATLDIPISPRVRGSDLSGLLAGQSSTQPPYAFAETDEQTLLARDALRLVCARRVGACRLFDVSKDPLQQRDVSADNVKTLAEMKMQLRSLSASHGHFESGSGSRSWPQALRRGIAGDTDAAREVGALLDDADVEVRRKAAEVLFALRRTEIAPQLRRALARDEDEDVRRWAALALTRMGQGAPLSFDLVQSSALRWRRLAALALAEAGDDRGEQVLLNWWRSAYPEAVAEEQEPLEFQRAKELIAGLARIKSTAAVGALAWGLRDLRLRPHIAKAMAEIGNHAARPALGKAFAEERYHDSRAIIARALVDLEGSPELRDPLVRFLGVPDPLMGGVGLALESGLLRYIGGPSKRGLRRLRAYATSGVSVGMIVPKGGNGRGFRVLVRAKVTGLSAGEVRFGALDTPIYGDRTQAVPRKVPKVNNELTTTLRILPGEQMREVFGTLPPAVSATLEPGEHADFVVYATQNVAIDACAVVPLADELPPVAAKPWAPGEAGAGPVPAVVPVTAD